MKANPVSAGRSERIVQYALKPPADAPKQTTDKSPGGDCFSVMILLPPGDDGGPILVLLAHLPLRGGDGIRFAGLVHQCGGGQPDLDSPAAFGGPLQAVGLQNLGPGKLFYNGQRFLLLVL